MWQLGDVWRYMPSFLSHPLISNSVDHSSLYLPPRPSPSRAGCHQTAGIKRFNSFPSFVMCRSPGPTVGGSSNGASLLEEVAALWRKLDDGAIVSSATCDLRPLTRSYFFGLEEGMKICTWWSLLDLLLSSPPTQPCSSPPLRSSMLDVFEKSVLALSCRSGEGEKEIWNLLHTSDVSTSNWRPALKLISEAFFSLLFNRLNFSFKRLIDFEFHRSVLTSRRHSSSKVYF